MIGGGGHHEIEPRGDQYSSSQSAQPRTSKPLPETVDAAVRPRDGRHGQQQEQEQAPHQRGAGCGVVWCGVICRGMNRKE